MMKEKQYYVHWNAPVCITESVRKRLKYSPEIPKRKGLYRLSDYIYAGKLKGWDLSRDVNYLYARVIYPPEDIRRRIRRICNDPEAKWGEIYEALGDFLNYHPAKIPASIDYAKVGLLSCYCELLQYISRKENKLQFPDAIQLED